MRASLIFELPGPKGSCIYLSTYSLIQMFSNILIVQGQGHALCLKSVGKFDTKKPRRSLQLSWLAIYFEFYSSATPSRLTKDSIHSIFHKFSCFFFFKSSNNRNCSDSMNIRRKSFAWLINLTGTCEHLLFVGCQVRVPWEMSGLWSPCSPEAHNLELQSLWTSPLGGHPDRCGGMQLLSAQVEEKHIVQVMTLDNLQRQ